MDAQLSFASLDFAGKKKRTKRDVFLAEMAAVVPWSALAALVERFDAKVGRRGGGGVGACGGAAGLRESVLSKGWPAGWSATVSHRCDVAHLLPAAVVLPFGSRCRGDALRHPIDACVLSSRAWPRHYSRRDDDLELPASA